MRKTNIVTLILVTAMSRAWGADVSINKREVEYRKLISDFDAVSNEVVILEAEMLNTDQLSKAKMYRRIITLKTRLEFPDVFVEMQSILNNIRRTSELENWNANRPYPGPLPYMLRKFVSRGPETNVVFTYNRTRGGETNQAGKVLMRGLHIKSDAVSKTYSEDEVATGKLRNAAARLAVLEHIEYFLDSNSEYEQYWLEDFALAVFGKNRFSTFGHSMKVDYVEDFDELVRKIMNNESLAPSTRIRAAYYLASDTDYDPSSIMRGIVTNLPADKPSAELVRSLQSIADFVPEAAKKLCDFEKVQLIENSDVD